MEEIRYYEDENSKLTMFIKYQSNKTIVALSYKNGHESLVGC